MPLKLQITTGGPHQGQPSLVFVNPSPELRELVVVAVTDNWTPSPAYKAKKGADPFLQSNCEDFVLVEFWGRTPETFVNYLQQEINEANLER